VRRTPATSSTSGGVVAEEAALDESCAPGSRLLLDDRIVVERVSATTGRPVGGVRDAAMASATSSPCCRRDLNSPLSSGSRADRWLPDCLLDLAHGFHLGSLDRNALRRPARIARSNCISRLFHRADGQRQRERDEDRGAETSQARVDRRPAPPALTAPSWTRLRVRAPASVAKIAGRGRRRLAGVFSRPDANHSVAWPRVGHRDDVREGNDNPPPRPRKGQRNIRFIA